MDNKTLIIGGVAAVAAAIILTQKPATAIPGGGPPGLHPIVTPPKTPPALPPITPVTPPTYDFAFSDIPYQSVQKGSTITISFTITSRCNKTADITPMAVVYENGFWGPGTQLGNPYQLDTVTIQPGYQQTFSFSHITQGADGEKDVVISIWVDGVDRKEQRYAKAFKVTSSSIPSTPDLPFIGPPAPSTPTLPNTGDIVTFSVWCDRLPLFSDFNLYYYDPIGQVWDDGVLHSPGDVVTFGSVPTGGYFAMLPRNRLTGQWGDQATSSAFLAQDGTKYKYDIPSGVVYFA